MTGAAARLCDGRRRAICLDLSPLASFIAYCVNSCMPGSSFQTQAELIIKDAKEKYGWMFQTKHSNGSFGEINYVLWSNSYYCCNCGTEIIFWESAVDKAGGKIMDVFQCPDCGVRVKKSDLDKVNEIRYDNITRSNLNETKRVPVLINYSYQGKRYEKKPDGYDLDILDKIIRSEPSSWIPLDKTYAGDELSRCYRDGIEYFFQYYTKRTLLVLSHIKSLVKDIPIFNYLITKLAFQTTIMYRYTYMNGCWGAGGGPMSGTLYVPSLFKELNVFGQLDGLTNARNKIEINDNANNVLISTQSVLDLSLLREGSIDYIFTDPPFGKNFMYSEMNRISEMWLKVHTNSQDECIISNSQKKDFLAYQNLMQGAFQQYFRLLKPNKWMSVEFSNTSAMVWACIQNAIQNAGFVIANISALDKKKESFKAVTTTTAVKQDLVITCFKPSDEMTNLFESSENTSLNVWDFVEELLEHLPVHMQKEHTTTAVVERSPKILYDRMIAYYVQHNYPVPMNAAEFQKGLRDHFVERDGMYFTATQVVEYEDKKSKTSDFQAPSLFVSSEADGITWIKNELKDHEQTYSELQPKWMQAMVAGKKGDQIPELMQILEENFIKNEAGVWHNPDPENEADLERVRTRKLLHEFAIYVETAQKPKAKIKEARLEALRCGFKQCYKDRDFATIMAVSSKLPESLLTEDEVLLQYYDIASMRV